MQQREDQNGILKSVPNSPPNSSAENASNLDHEVLAERIYDEVQQLIISGELRANQRLIESDIARRLGTSRTPVREALKRLELTGYAVPNPSRGLVVADHTMQIKSLFEIREALECMALELSCPYLTEEQVGKAEDYLKCIANTLRKHDIEQYIGLHRQFHETLYVACDNERLRALISIFRYPQLDKMLARLQTRRELDAIMKYHSKILEEIRRRNVGRATKLLKRHFRYSLKIALRRL